MKCNINHKMDFLPFVFLLILGLTSCIQLTASVRPALLLTPLLQANRSADARRLSAVPPALFLNRSSHAGFLTVDPRYNSNTFFWYFPVADKPVNETPWIIWLQGGPGATSLAGLFDEIGPFKYEGSLKRREYSWSSEFSIVFVDNPVGAGFSFTDHELGFASNRTTYSNHLYSALQQFLTVFPELRKAPLYLAGESYAGRYIPAFASRILSEGALPAEWEVNLQGLIMGNPVMNRKDIANLTAAYYQWGLLDHQGVQQVKPVQDAYIEAVIQGNYTLAFKYRDQLIIKLSDLSMQSEQYNVLKDDAYNFKDFEEYISREEVREALHVGNIKFTFDNGTVHHKMIPDFLSDVDTDVEKLLDHYKILIYCGQLDLTAPCVPNAEGRRRRWHWERRGQFLSAPRLPWWHNETVAGYVKSGGGFMEALIRGAGHLAPIEKPAQVLELVSYFVRDLNMVLPPNYVVPSISVPDYLPDKPEPPPSNDSKSQTNQTKTVDDTTSKPSDKESASDVQHLGIDRPNVGTIVSAVFNVIFIIIIVGGVALYYRQKKRNDDFFYNNVDNNSDDLFLT